MLELLVIKIDLLVHWIPSVHSDIVSLLCTAMSPKSMKRPAANAGGESAKKKPSVSTSGINQFISEASKGTEDDPQDQQIVAHRDKGKAEKFAKMLKAGAIPPHIAHMWQVESKKQPSCR